MANRQLVVFYLWWCRTSEKSVNNSNSLSQIKETFGCVSAVCFVESTPVLKLNVGSLLKSTDSFLCERIETITFSSINVLYADHISTFRSLIEQIKHEHQRIVIALSSDPETKMFGNRTSLLALLPKTFELRDIRWVSGCSES